jgi:hypothetical protein
MAFTLDRMLSWQNPMRTRLESGRYFIRYVIIEDEAQRRSICAALNQWIASSSEKATGIGVKFSSSTEPPATDPNVSSPASQQVGCAKASDIRCPALLPSGF